MDEESLLSGKYPSESRLGLEDTGKDGIISIISSMLFPTLLGDISDEDEPETKFLSGVGFDMPAEKGRAIAQHLRESQRHCEGCWLPLCSYRQKLR